MKPFQEYFELRGQVALVTGGAMGIGEGIVRRLAAQGAAVAIADIDEKKGQALSEELTRSGVRSLFVRTDISDLAQLKGLVSTVVRELGRLDILVNNAGIFPFAAATEVTPELWDRVLGINLRGAFFLAQGAARQMKDQGSGGSIVNIASVDALHPTGQLAPYDASKGGLRMLTRSLAFEWSAFGVRVNAIAPGSIQTPGASAATAVPAGADPAQLFQAFLARIPLKRMGEPDDIARAVLFLASPAASYVTGVTLVVDGGYLLA